MMFPFSTILQKSFSNAASTTIDCGLKMFLSTLLVVITAAVDAKRREAIPAPNRCKYSVRDVAFVNVHGKPWQLQLIKPANISDEQFNSYNQIIESGLRQSNVGHIWFSHESDQASRLIQQIAVSESNAQSVAPTMALVGPENNIFPFPKSESGFADQLDHLLNSPARKNIVDAVVQSLCVFVLIESGDADQDEKAHTMVDLAIKQVNRQMWTLEKPTDIGPVLVSISKEQSKQESWLLASLGIESSTSPSIAIVYGQGRRLGEVLSGDDLDVDSLVGRASICGQDCECRLDRQWLYGHQFIHVWDAKLELQAETILTFDPHSSFVMAEVAQIIRKNSIQNNDNRQINLGTGLIIHDLQPINSESVSEPDNNSGIETVETNRDAEFPPSSRTVLPDSTSPAMEPDGANAARNVPWFLIFGLSGIAIGLFVWRKLFST